MAAIDAFGIDVSRIHWDMTSMSLYGDYDAVYEAYPIPDYGHPKDRRTDLTRRGCGAHAPVTDRGFRARVHGGVSGFREWGLVGSHLGPQDRKSVV